MPQFHDNASTSTLQNVRFDETTLDKIEKDRIVSLASLYDFAQTAMWYRRIGGMLSIFDYETLAITYIEKAMELDSSDWSHKASLAICYRSRSKTLRDKDGIFGYALLREAFQEIPIDDPRRPRILGLISTTASLIGDYETAADMSKEALKINPEDKTAMLSYLVSLFSNRAFQTTADWLGDLSTKTSSETGETLLMDFLLNCLIGLELYSLIGWMLQEVDKIDWAYDKFRQALSIAERAQSSLALARVKGTLANFLLERMDHRQDAMVLLEESLKSAKNSELKKRLSNMLSDVYFKNAREAHETHTSHDIWIQKLIELAVQKNTIDDKDNATIYGINDASLMLGKWYRLRNEADKAKACFRPTILQGIDILTDDDPDNDMDGYIKLARTLLYAGDQRNASTAFAVCVAPLDHLKAERARSALPSVVTSSPNPFKKIGHHHENDSVVDRCVASNSTKSPDVTSESVTLPVIGSNNDALPDAVPAPPQTKDDGPTISDSRCKETTDSTKHDDTAESGSTSRFPFGCDGCCSPTISRREEDFVAFYICEICRDIMLCDYCFDRRKTKWMTRKCSPDHTFYRTYPLPTNLEDVGVVDIDGKILPRPGWLKELREEWAQSDD